MQEQLQDLVCSFSGKYADQIIIVWILFGGREEEGDREIYSTDNREEQTGILGSSLSFIQVCNILAGVCTFSFRIDYCHYSLQNLNPSCIKQASYNSYRLQRAFGSLIYSMSKKSGLEQSLREQLLMSHILNRDQSNLLIYK